jgi:predicted dehydrogenase
MLDAVSRKAGVKHMVAFNYRFVPAIRLARELIESGALGRIYHFRAVYLQEWIMPHYNTPMIWRLEKEVAGSGALGDLGAHIIDLGRFLVGEIESVSAMTRPSPRSAHCPTDGHGHPVDVDDAFVAAVELRQRRYRHAGGDALRRRAQEPRDLRDQRREGQHSSSTWSAQRTGGLLGGRGAQGDPGLPNVLVSEPYHPWWENWWPQGHMIGWEHTFVHELTHFLDCIVNDRSWSRPSWRQGRLKMAIDRPGVQRWRIHGQ